MESSSGDSDDSSSSSHSNGLTSSSSPPQPSQRWVAEDPFILYDLKERHDLRQSLLTRFYDEFLPTYFPFEDELEPVEVWEEMMDPDYKDSVFHVVVAFDQEDRELKEILGGCVFEYGRESDCGLISYFVVSPMCRGKGLGRLLIERSVEITHADARAAGLKGGCPAIFAETNDPTKVKAEEDTVPPEVRVRMLQRIGFKRLEMEFVQPPLQEGKNPCANLWLLVYQPEKEEEGRERTSLPAELLLRWVNEYWRACCAYFDPDYERSYVELRAMRMELSSKESVRIVDIVPS
ncbi:hypothetical protein QOT17_022077 [Balamuthia mandrillaris]